MNDQAIQEGQKWMEHMRCWSMLTVLTYWAKYTYQKVKHRSCISHW